MHMAMAVMGPVPDRKKKGKAGETGIKEHINWINVCL